MKNINTIFAKCVEDSMIGWDARTHGQLMRMDGWVANENMILQGLAVHLKSRQLCRNKFRFS